VPYPFSNPQSFNSGIIIFPQNIVRNLYDFASISEFGRIFCLATASHSPGKKPGFPLQVLGFAYANPVGFPLQSQCAAQRANLRSTFATSQDAWASSKIAYAILRPAPLRGRQRRGSGFFNFSGFAVNYISSKKITAR
jgi:hypothetical protein